jgi:hypothetical protein
VQFINFPDLVGVLFLVCIDKVIQNIDLVRTFGALHETMASTSPLGTCRRGVQRMFCEFLTGRHCSPRKKTWQFAGICVKRRVSVYVLDDFARCLGFGADYYISSATGFIRSLFVNGQYIPGVGTPGHQICAPKC